MMDFLLRSIAAHLLDIVAAVCSYIAARYLLDLSTPEKDWRAVQRWRLFDIELRWYRGWEYFHQVRGMRILGRV